MERPFESIIQSNLLIPFTENEVRAAMENVKIRRSKGTDLSLGHPGRCSTPSEILELSREGVIFFHSPIQLEGAFAFTKLDAGRGLFGGQKAVYASYVSADLASDLWEPGVIFKSWMTAITSLGNIYRGYGLA